MNILTMLKIYFRTLIVTWKVYGFGRVLLTWLLAEPLAKLFTGLTMALDHLFFPGFKKRRVEKPVFIIGHPRSGTTFLHHLLTRADDAVAFPTWHLFFPALSARVLMAPLVKLLIRIGKTEVMPESTGHRIALDEPEEEEMLLLNNYETNFVNIGMLSFDDREYPELQYHDRQPREQRFRAMRFLDGCFRRQIHATGRRRIIAQTHFSTFRLKTMLEFYPDAKFVFVLRNPHHVVPSFLSLLHKSIEFRWGIDKIKPELLRRYNERRYQAMIDLYRYFYELDKNNQLPKDRVMVLGYDQLRADLEGAVARIAEFTGLEISARLRQEVAARALKQKDYQRKHAVLDLQHFGLSRERISRDFAFVFEQYGQAEGGMDQ